MVALIGITAGTLYQKRFCAGVDLRTGSVIQFGAAFAAMLPFVIASDRWQVDFAAEFWLALGWSVLVLSLVAMALLLTMIRRGRAKRPFNEIGGRWGLRGLTPWPRRPTPP